MDAGRIDPELERLVGRLESATRRFGDLLQAAAEAEVSHKRSHAKALLAARGTVSERESQAVLVTADLFRERRIAEALAESQREYVRSLRWQIDGLRSLSASVRAQT